MKNKYLPWARRILFKTTRKAIDRQKTYAQNRYYRQRGCYWFIPTERYESFRECRFKWQLRRVGFRARLWKQRQK